MWQSMDIYDLTMQYKYMRQLCKKNFEVKNPDMKYIIVLVIAVVIEVLGAFYHYGTL